MISSSSSPVEEKMVFTGGMKVFESTLGRLTGDTSPDARYLVAVSGGVDSTVLLRLMLRAVMPAQILVAHFNHKLRKSASDEDETFVRDTAARFGVKFISAQGKGEKSDEAFLRRERRAFLRSVARPHDFIVLAHHADDQLETILMRLIRGTGVTGLCGMASRRGRFIRPLLEVSRTEIREWARDNDVSFREDQSNASERYFRNRVRQKIVPAMIQEAEPFGGESAFYSRLSGTLAEIAEISRQHHRRTRAFIKKYAVETPYWLRVPSAAFFEGTSFEHRRRLRAVLRKLGTVVPSRRRLEGILAEATSGASTICIPGEVTLRPSCGQLFFQNVTHRRRLAEAPAPRLIDGRLTAEAVGLTARLTSFTDVETRTFRAGDVHRAKKLKRRLLDARIPGPERALLPLLVNSRSGETVWYFPQSSSGISEICVTFPFSFL